MSSAYTPEGSYPDIQIGPANQVSKVQVMQASTIPSGVYFAIPVLTSAWTEGRWQETMLLTAEGIESMLGMQYVVSTSYVEDLDDNGLVQSYMQTLIQIPAPPGSTGPFQTYIQVPLGLLGEGPRSDGAELQALIDDAVAALQTTTGA